MADNDGPTIPGIIPPHMAAMLNYYGFHNFDGWPIDGEGRLHLLGEGDLEAFTFQERYPLRELLHDNVLSDQFPVEVHGTFEQGPDTYEVIYASGVYNPATESTQTTLIQRPIGTSSAGQFDARTFGLDAKVVDTTAIDAHIQNNSWTLYGNPSQSVDTSSAGYRGYPAPRLTPIFPNGWDQPRYSTYFGNNDANHYWNPYQGTMFFLRIGANSEYYLYALVSVQYGLPGGAATPPTRGWARLPTGVFGDPASPPMSLADLHEFLELRRAGPAQADLLYPGSPWEYAGNVAGEPVAALEMAQYFESARFASYTARRTSDTTVLHSGTWGEFLQISKAPVSIPIDKHYQDGTTAPAGSITALRARMTPRTGSGITRSDLHYWRSLDPAGGLYGGGVRPVNGYYAGSSFWREGPEGAAQSPPAVRSLAVVLRMRAWCIEFAIALVDHGSTETPHTVAEILYKEHLPFTNARTNPLVDQSHNFSHWFPGPSWEAARMDRDDTGGTYCTFDPQPLQFMTLPADDGSFHDPRYNTATNAVEQFLEADDGLCYDGPFGRLPRPRSQATGEFLGQEITGDTDFAIDVLLLPEDEGHLVVMVKDGRFEAWTHQDETSTSIWSAPIEESVPPSILELLTEGAPALDLRFLHPDWPTPTGVLTIDEWSFTVTPRRPEHHDYSWEVDDTTVSPPFILTPAWTLEERFPYPNPRAKLYIEGDEDPGDPT